MRKNSKLRVNKGDDGRTRSNVSMEERMEKFIKERNDALFSLNKEKIIFFMRKYGIQPYQKPNEEVGELDNTTLAQRDKLFWSNVHYAILQINSATIKQKEISKLWLLDNGFSLRFTEGVETNEQG